MATTKTNEVDFLDKPMGAANKTAPKWQQKTPAKYPKPEAVDIAPCI